MSRCAATRCDDAASAAEAIERAMSDESDAAADAERQPPSDAPPAMSRRR